MTESLADRFETTDLPESVDEAAVDRLATVAHLLDECVRLPGGVSVGLDPLLGVVPGVGDALSAGLSLYIVGEAAYLGVSYTTVVRMLANVAVDVVGGSVPVVGLLFDVFWRANRRNVELVLDELGVDDTERVDGHGDDAAVDTDSDGVVTIEVEMETNS